VATINIANLTFTHKGNYDGSTAYVKNDVVFYATNGNAYIAKQNTTGNAPTNGTYWSQFAAGSGGIWNAGLSLGSAGQAVKVNAAGNALEFGTAGGVIQRKIIHDPSTGSVASNTPVEWTPFNMTFTPTATGNILELELSSMWSSRATQWGAYFYDSTNAVKIGVGNADGSRQRLALTSGVNNANSWVSVGHSKVYYAAPNTNATIFKVYIGTHGGTTFYHNRNNQNSNSSNVDDARVTSSFSITEYASSIYTGSGQNNA
jgi:hypothetical protein